MKNIVLTGMPGCGKSTIAKAIYKKLENFTLIDIDEEIEKSENTTITKIFELKGEDYFRNIENKIIQQTSKKNSIIVSLGGGAFQKEQNQINLKENGIIFFLDCPVEKLYERINDEKQRPLIQTKNPLETIQTLYEKRKNNFKKADFTINADNDINEIVENIIRIYKENA